MGKYSSSGPAWKLFIGVLEKFLYFYIHVQSFVKSNDLYKKKLEFTYTYSNTYTKKK